MRNKDGTFQQDIQCIVQPKCNRGGVFISNIQAASNPLTLSKHGIGAVISAVQGKNLSHLMPKHIQYLYIPAIDHQTFDISIYFDMTYQFLQQETQKTNVLVHCMAGVSRSVTLVIAYLMRSQGITFSQAIAFVKSKRKIISPNESFIAQLKKLESKIQKNTSWKGIESVSSNSSWFSKNKQSGSTSSSWYHKNDGCLEVKKGFEGGYDKSLKQKIKSLFEAKSQGKNACK